MTTKVFDCRQINLSHEQMLELNKAGQCTLGIDNLVAESMITNGIRATKTAVRGAYYFWMFVGLAGLGYSIYLSFTHAWWWFVIGFAAAGAFARILQKSNAENFVYAAGFDREFYEQVRSRNGWLYRIDEAIAAKHRVG